MGRLRAARNAGFAGRESYRNVSRNNAAPRLGLVASAVALCLASGGTALAQQQAAEGPTEQVVVTGTRLVTSGVNTPTPVTVVSGPELQTMDPGALVDSMSQLPQFSRNLTTQQAVGGSVAPGGSNLNLRGLDAQRTLVLLDGHRLGPGNKFGTVDVAIIPETLIQSVEAVTGGASAAYGADAVAGVVNFRLDRSFTGFKYGLQGGTTTYRDDNNYKASLAYGADVGQRGHVIMSAETYHRNGIRSFESLQERSDYYDLKARVTNPDPNGPANLAARYVQPTNYRPGGIILQSGFSLDHNEFLPDGTGRYRPLPFSGIGQLSGGCNCQAQPTLDYGVNSDYEIDSPADRYSAFAHFDYDLSDRNSFYVESLLADTSDSARWQTIALLLPWVGRVFYDNPFLPGSISQAMQDEGYESVGFGIFTPNTTGNPFDTATLDAKNRYGQVTGGFSHSMSSDFLAGGWTLDGYLQYAQNRQETVVPGGIRTDRLFLAMDAVTDPATGEPVCRVTLYNPGIFDKCVPINLFGGTAAVTPAAAHYVTDNGKYARGRTTELDAEVTFAGDITQGSGVLGPISAAFGVSWRQEELAVRTVDPCDEYPCTIDGVRLSDLGLMSPDLRGILPETDPVNGIPGLRYVPPGFAGDSNSSTVLFSSQRAVAGGYSVREGFFEFGIPLLDDGKLNLDEAYRVARYTGSGTEAAWKSGISYQITPQFRIRATRSQDVRAPTLRERFESQRGGVAVTDPQNNGDLISTASFSGGNPNVGLETALTDTIGVVITPADKFSLTIDSYDIDLDGAIGQLRAQDIVDDCYESGGASSLCQYVHRDSTGEINRVDALYINLSNQRIKGVDVEMNYSGINVGPGTLSWRLLSARLDENSVLTPGTPRDDRAGDVGTFALPKTRVTTNLTWAQGPFSVFLQARYIGGGTMDRRLTEGVDIDINSVDSVTYYDMTFSYSGQRSATPWQFYATVNNLFNEIPPAVYPRLGRTGTPAPSSLLYDTIGRRGVVGVRVNF